MFNKNLIITYGWMRVEYKAHIPTLSCEMRRIKMKIRDDFVNSSIITSDWAKA